MRKKFICVAWRRFGKYNMSKVKAELSRRKKIDALVMHDYKGLEELLQTH